MNPSTLRRRDLLLAAAASPLSGLALGCAAPRTAGGGGWATGGTAAMAARARYPDPFVVDRPARCVRTGPLVQGPCYAQAEALQDISYGHLGLPMRMCLRVLDASCAPAGGATVDVWHAAPTGKYSGSDPAHEIVGFCTGDDAEYASHLYFRGSQTTDARGVVAFDTCFPGWYPGRTVHVHVAVRAGAASLTSQLVFADALDDEILASQPIYRDRGRRDTTNARDGVMSAYAELLFDARRMPDGALLAWKSIVLGA